MVATDGVCCLTLSQLKFTKYSICFYSVLGRRTVNVIDISVVVAAHMPGVAVALCVNMETFLLFPQVCCSEGRFPLLPQLRTCLSVAAPVGPGGVAAAAAGGLGVAVSEQVGGGTSVCVSSVMCFINLR